MESARGNERKNQNEMFDIKRKSIEWGGRKLTLVTEARLGHACQGVVWSDDGKRLLVQCSVERDIRTFDFDGKTLTERPEAAIPMVSRPGVMVTAKTR